MGHAEPGPGAGVTAIVVAYRSGATLERCLQALAAAPEVGEIIVVDNDPATGSTPACAKVRYLPLPGNPGFAVACNRGAASARGPWLVFINPDCYVEVDTFGRIAACIAGQQRIGAVGADIRGPQGHREPAVRRRHPTLLRVLRQCAGSLGGRSEALYLPPAGMPLQDVEATSGAFLLMPAAVFREVGGFDEAYRLHVEDLDLCRRLHGRGYRVVVAGSVCITHVKGTSSGGRPFFVTYHKYRGLMLYWLRWGAGGGPAATALAVLLTAVAYAVSVPVSWLRWMRRGR